MTEFTVGVLNCGCRHTEHVPKRVVLTGGPGAGKTAVLQMMQHALCKHVALLPEAASIVFGGGFPRHDTDAGRRAAQRAIYRIQREVEALVEEEQQVAIALCDRGTVDGLAYWPGAPGSYWKALSTTHEQELARYAAVIHLETPGLAHGYNRSNLLRIESAEEAIAIDARIAEAWSLHPRRFVVASTATFVEKAARAVDFIRAELPACCQKHSFVPVGS
jgi:predicted ATPase